MVIKYTFSDGTVSEVEVSDEVGSVILEFRRQEESLDRKEKRHCCSIDSADYEGKIYATEETPEMIFQNKLDSEYIAKRIAAAMDKLSAVQRRRFLMFANGFSMRKIARLENVDHHSVKKSIEGARKILKKFF